MTEHNSYLNAILAEYNQGMSPDKILDGILTSTEEHIPQFIAAWDNFISVHSGESGFSPEEIALLQNKLDNFLDE